MLAWTPTLIVLAWLFFTKRIGVEEFDEEYNGRSETAASQNPHII
jgi:hypothetical protein